MIVDVHDGRLRLYNLTGASDLDHAEVSYPAGAAETYRGATSPPPYPRVVDDDARFTVYRPRVLSPGRWASLLVFAQGSRLAGCDLRCGGGRWASPR